MRVFISLEIPDDVKREIIRIQKEVDKLGLIKGKFTEPENLHLTLKFLGNLSEAEVRAIREKLKNLRFNPFYIELKELGVFSENFIRIVWVGLYGKEVFELQKDVDKVLGDLFPKEHRFMSHVTIARPKYVEDRKMFLDELKKISLNKTHFLVDKIYLKESILTRQGADYNIIAEIPSLQEEQIITS